MGNEVVTNRGKYLFQNLRIGIFVRHWKRGMWIRICVWQGYEGINVLTYRGIKVYGYEHEETTNV